MFRELQQGCLELQILIAVSCVACDPSSESSMGTNSSGKQLQRWSKAIEHFKVPYLTWIFFAVIETHHFQFRDRIILGFFYLKENLFCIGFKPGLYFQSVHFHVCLRTWKMDC